MRADREQARLLAHLAGRSLPIRATRALVPDGDGSLAIAAVTRAGSRELLAIGLARGDGRSWHAVAEPGGFTEDQAARLDGAIRRFLARPDGGRVWLADVTP